MYHELPPAVRFWPFLLAVDQDLAQTTRQKGCACGGRLHRANYPRKPRGADDLPPDYACRFSFCCACDGCRKRVTPPSVRFLGRKVYLFAVVVLVSAMRQGPAQEAHHGQRGGPRRLGPPYVSLSAGSMYFPEKPPRFLLIADESGSL